MDLQSLFSMPAGGLQSLFSYSPMNYSPMSFGGSPGGSFQNPYDFWSQYVPGQQRMPGDWGLSRAMQPSVNVSDYLIKQNIIPSGQSPKTFTPTAANPVGDTGKDYWDQRNQNLQTIGQTQTPSPLVQDLNGDWVRTWDDLDAMSRQWQNNPFDANADGVATWDDLSFLTNLWKNMNGY